MSDKNSSELKKGALGFPEALATAVGLIIASSVLLTATQGFGVAGGVFAISIVIAFVIMMCQNTSFAEMAGIMPTSGAIYDYIAAGLGRFWAITGTLAAFLVVHIFAGSAEALATGLFAQVNFPVLGAIPAWIIGSVIVIIFGVVNFLGIDVFGRVELIMTAFMWGTLMIFSVIGVFKAPVAELDGFFGASQIGASFPVILAMVGLAMFLFVGVEYVTPLAPELKDSSRTVTRALFWGVTLVGIAMFLYGGAIARQVPNEVLDPATGLTMFDTPLPIPAFAESIFGRFGVIWLGIAVLLAGCATLNTIIAGLPRILYGMAKDGSFPAMFAKLHPRYKTPVNGIILAVIIPIVVTFIAYSRFGDGAIDAIFYLILAAVCAWIFSYILVDISVIMLRQSHPNIHRPYKTPFYPLPQIIAIVGMLVTLWNIAPPFLTRAQIYIPFAIVLVICAILALVFTYGLGNSNPWERVDPAEILEEEGIISGD
ncbi:MAG: APC family permease [Chloroflexota bacterium]